MTYQNVLITGASSGIGRGLALALARRGAYVVAAARRRDRLQSLVDEIAAAGGRAEALELDCGDADATHAAVQKIDARLPLDLVIANAGVGKRMSGKHLEWEAVKQMLNTNLMGAIATLCAAAPGMVERKRGHLVGVASLAGLRGLPKYGAYCASKAGLITFLESLRVDLRAVDIAVTAICPGYVRTEMTAGVKDARFMVELDDAVKIILRAIDRREFMCSFPMPMAAPMRAISLLPSSAYELVMSKMPI
jgi:short-subunit dehydrogenase